jgi:hypothetical protein
MLDVRGGDGNRYEVGTGRRPRREAEEEKRKIFRIKKSFSCVVDK